MDEKIFKQLKEVYDSMQSEFRINIKSYREKSVRQCINKGYFIDVLPFEHELRGYKLCKKHLDKMVMKDGYFVHYFNSEDKVCLIEEASTFLNRIENYTLYDYHENYLCKYEYQDSGVISVNKYFITNGKIVEGYTYAKFGHCYEQYVYNEEQLEKILYTHFDHQQEESSYWEHFFYYDKKQKLKLIQQVHKNGYVVNIYADIKLNYKKLEIQLYEVCKEKIELFFKQHITEKIEALAIRLWIDDLQPMLDINFQRLGDKETSVAEWTYLSVTTINIAEVPLDSVQQEKLVLIVYNVLAKLIDECVICKNIKVKVFYHDEKEIGLNKKAIQKIVMGRENFS